MPALLALPFFIPAVLVTDVPPELFMHGLSKISASFIAAASVAVFHLLARERAAPRWAACATLFYAFGTFSFSVSSQALYQHAPAQLGLALGLWGLLRDKPSREDDFIAGFGFALAFASRPDSIFFFAPAGLYMLFKERRRVPFFSAGAAIPAAFLAYYWLVYAGRLRPQDSEAMSGYFRPFQPYAIVCLLFSPTRGLLPFVPAALFGLWGMAEKLRDPRTPWAPWLACSLPGLIVFFSFFTWTGGQTFGTRYFATSCLVLALFALEQSRKIAASPLLRRLWCLAVSWSVLVHAIGAYFTWPGSFQFIEQKAQLWDLSLYPPLYLGSASGPLFTLPVPLRWAAAAAAVAMVFYASKRMDRWLAE
jgi:Gpi18-like mannosyltransferase